MADCFQSWLVLLAIGVGGGLVSSLLGVGGGIVVTSSLMSLGIPSLICVSTQLANSVGTNFSGFLAYQREQDVDFGLAWYLLIGGIFGALVEKYLIFSFESQPGGYAILRITVFVLLIIGGLLFCYQASKKNNANNHYQGAYMRKWMRYFPAHRVFLRSRVEMSIFIPIIVGFFTGMLTTSLGGSNSMLIAPILTYLICRTSPVVSGTSLLSGFCMNLFITFLVGSTRAPVDFVLLPILVIGGAVGSIVGVKISHLLSRRALGLMGGILLLTMAYKLYLELKESKWKSITQGRTFFYRYEDIIEKITDSGNLWMKPIIDFGYQNPSRYTMYSLLCVLAVAYIIQLTARRLLVRL